MPSLPREVQTNADANREALGFLAGAVLRGGGAARDLICRGRA